MRVNLKDTPKVKGLKQSNEVGPGRRSTRTDTDAREKEEALAIDSGTINT